MLESDVCRAVLLAAASAYKKKKAHSQEEQLNIGTLPLAAGVVSMHSIKYIKEN